MGVRSGRHGGPVRPARGSLSTDRDPSLRQNDPLLAKNGPTITKTYGNLTRPLPSPPAAPSGASLPPSRTAPSLRAPPKEGDFESLPAPHAPSQINNPCSSLVNPSPTCPTCPTCPTSPTSSAASLLYLPRDARGWKKRCRLVLLAPQATFQSRAPRPLPPRSALRSHCRIAARGTPLGVARLWPPFKNECRRPLLNSRAPCPPTPPPIKCASRSFSHGGRRPATPSRELPPPFKNECRRPLLNPRAPRPAAPAVSP